MSENVDINQAIVDEVVVLKKFDGNYTQEQIDAGEVPEPVETITIHNGEVVEHWRKEEDE